MELERVDLFCVLLFWHLALDKKLKCAWLYIEYFKLRSVKCVGLLYRFCFNWYIICQYPSQSWNSKFLPFFECRFPHLVIFFALFIPNVFPKLQGVPSMKITQVQRIDSWSLANVNKEALISVQFTITRIRYCFIWQLISNFLLYWFLPFVAYLLIHRKTIHLHWNIIWLHHIRNKYIWGTIICIIINWPTQLY